MNVSFHSPSDLPEALQAFWKRTCERQDPAGLFARSPRWLALITDDAPDCARVAAARDARGAYRVVLPLAARKRPMPLVLFGKELARRSWPALNIVGGDIIEDGVTAADLAELWCGLAAEFPQAQLVVLDHVSTVERAARVMTSARQSGLFTAHILTRDVPHYRLHLPDRLEVCLGRRGKKSLARLRSKANALGREVGAELSLVEIRSRVDWEPYAERIEVLMNQAWQAELLGQQFRISDYDVAADAGHLRAFLLLCGERAVALTIYYQGMGTLISAALGYDRALARHSPGAILMLRVIERLYARDTPKCLDFGEGDADYKQQWADEEICAQRILLVRRRADMQAWAAAQRLCAAATRGGRALLQALGLERRVVRRLKRG